MQKIPQQFFASQLLEPKKEIPEEMGSELAQTTKTQIGNGSNELLRSPTSDSARESPREVAVGEWGYFFFLGEYLSSFRARR